MGEALGSSQALGIPFSNQSIACDKKSASQAWISSHFAGDVAHVFESMGELATGTRRAKCTLHNGLCIVPTDRPDIVAVGPPCQPWSDMRWKGGQTKKTKTAKDHPDSSILFELVPAYMEARKPYIGIIEETVSINRGDKQTGTSPYEVIYPRLLETFEAVQALKLDCRYWAGIARERIETDI